MKNICPPVENMDVCLSVVFHSYLKPFPINVYVHFLLPVIFFVVVVVFLFWRAVVSVPFP